jgi:hypothetical protein
LRRTDDGKTVGFPGHEEGSKLGRAHQSTNQLIGIQHNAHLGGLCRMTSTVNAHVQFGVANFGRNENQIYKGVSHAPYGAPSIE